MANKLTPPRPLYVRCVDHKVFPINRGTYEALSTGAYDPWCFSDPIPDVDYIEHAEWCRRLDLRSREEEMRREYYTTQPRAGQHAYTNANASDLNLDVNNFGVAQVAGHHKDSDDR